MLSITRRFTKPGQSPYHTIPFDERTAHDITILAPLHWSQLAIHILVQKYMRKTGVPQKNPQSPLGSERDARQVFHRLAHTWTVKGKAFGYFETEEEAQSYYDEMCYMLAAQIGAPNSPQWFNTGLHAVYGIEGSEQGHFYIENRDQSIRPAPNAYAYPQVSACFIQSVKDDLLTEGGIMDLWMRESRLFKFGSGSGTNFSNVRAAGEPLSGGGKSSGLMSFLKVGDRAAGAIKSGGTTRRAAKMICLDIDHPEILQFIGWKAAEEEKVAGLVAGSQLYHTHLTNIIHACQTCSNDNPDLAQAIASAQQAGISETYIQRAIALARAGHQTWPGQPHDVNWEGEAYQTVSGQNANMSVRIPHRFFDTLDSDTPWDLIARTTQTPMQRLSPQTIWQRLAEAAWMSGDPAVQYDTTINDWHTCPQDGPINASNPCSEYMFLDDTACNLASLNLVKFLQPDGTFHFEQYQHAIRLWTITLDISVSIAGYPSQIIASRSRDYRTIGLGYANLGSLLMRLGIPYDSKEACAFTSLLTALLTGHAYLTSAELAEALGAFPAYERNAHDMLRVIHKHAAATHEHPAFEYLQTTPNQPSLYHNTLSPALLTTIQDLWHVVQQAGKEHGFRNAQVSVIAPTGTIGLLMDCDTTGIEPDFSLIKTKSLAGGDSTTIVNSAIGPALQRLGYHAQTIEPILQYILTHNTMEGAPSLNPDHLPVFDCATQTTEGTRSLHPYSHLHIMAAAQPFISGAISKTVNLPHEATIQEIQEIYLMGYTLGLKSIAVYRNGSKLSQPLMTHASTSPSTHLKTPIQTTPSQSQHHRQILPPRRMGYTQKATISGHKIYLRTGEYQDGTLGEIFLDMHKEGAAFRSMTNCFAMAISLGLQHGVPLEEFVDAFTFTRFEPNGPVQGHDHIKMCNSIIDYIFRDLAITYLNRTDLIQGSYAALHEPTGTPDAPSIATAPMYEGDPCPTCDKFTLTRNGTCLLCHSCGSTTGCS